MFLDLSSHAFMFFSCFLGFLGLHSVFNGQNKCIRASKEHSGILIIYITHTQGS